MNKELETLEILNGIDAAIRQLDSVQGKLALGADEPWQIIKRVKKYLDRLYTETAKLYFSEPVIRSLEDAAAEGPETVANFIERQIQ